MDDDRVRVFPVHYAVWDTSAKPAPPLPWWRRWWRKITGRADR
jgi:hypothetical protein